jgi:hypothetical protein
LRRFDRWARHCGLPLRGGFRTPALGGRAGARRGAGIRKPRSKQTKAWLASQPVGRFEFTFTPKHGSWLNLVEGFFSKLARSVLRHIRGASKQEFKDRIMAAVDEFNRDPVVHTWSHKLDHAA